MWNVFEGISVLLIVLICSAASEDKCNIYQVPIGSGMTTVLESFKKEENLWIKPQSDFERLEIHLKVNNILSINPSYYLYKHIVIKSESILTSSYFQEQNWFPLKIKAFKKTPFIGLSKLMLQATVNKTMLYELDANLWYTQYTYQKFKLLAKGGISISRCNPSENITEATTTQAPITQAPTTKAPTTQAPTTKGPTTQATTTQAPTKLKSTTVSPFPNRNSTKKYNRDRDDEDDKVSLAYLLKDEGRYSLIILLITVALLAILLIASICFFIWRKKINNQCLSKRENEREENMYESFCSEKYFVSEGNKAPPVPPPTYSPKYPSLSSSESNKVSEEMIMENLYEVPKRSYPDPYVESQYLEMSGNQ